MIARKILDVKQCMQQLLMAETFDFFRLAKGKVIGQICYEIDGHLTEDYLSAEELEVLGVQQGECIPYGSVRNLFYEMIKGKRTPKYFHVTLLLPRASFSDVLQGGTLQPQQVSNFSLNITFQQGELWITSGCSLSIFSLDRSVEQSWDSWVSEFFSNLQITLEKSM